MDSLLSFEKIYLTCNICLYHQDMYEGFSDFGDCPNGQYIN